MAFVTKRQSEAASKRFQNQVKPQIKNVANFMEGIGDLRNMSVKAEFDTWSWYYSELSVIRVECSRLGLLVRMRDSNSWQYLRAYHAHIYSFLQMVMTILPAETADKITAKWKAYANDIDDYIANRNLLGKEYELDDQLITDIDTLYNIALKIAQDIGLGFKMSHNYDPSNSIEKRLMGE